MQETKEMWVQLLVWEDPLEKGIATHSNIFAWRIQWMGEPGNYSRQHHKELDMTEVTQHTSTHTDKTEGRGSHVKKKLTLI